MGWFIPSLLSGGWAVVALVFAYGAAHKEWVLFGMAVSVFFAAVGFIAAALEGSMKR